MAPRGGGGGGKFPRTFVAGGPKFGGPNFLGHRRHGRLLDTDDLQRIIISQSALAITLCYVK